MSGGLINYASLADDVLTGLNTTYAQMWKPNTAYTSGQFILNPSGQIVSANTAFTSGSSYSASNWTVVSGGSGSGLPSTYVARTTAYTASAGDAVEADVSAGGYTITLPAAPATGALVSVKKVDSSGNTLTIAPSGGGTIDGQSTATTSTQWAGLVLEHKGSNTWRVTASMATTGPQGPTGATGATGPQGPSGGGLFQIGSGRFVQLVQDSNAQLGLANLNMEVGLCLAVAGAFTLKYVGLQTYTGGTAGAVVRVGLRQDDGFGQPSTLIADLGTIAVTSGGITAGLSCNQAIGSVGRVWLTFTAQVATATYRGGTARAPFILPPTASTSSFTGGLAQSLVAMNTAVTGALPSTVNSPDIATNTTHGVSGVGLPLIVFGM